MLLNKRGSAKRKTCKALCATGGDGAEGWGVCLVIGWSWGLTTDGIGWSGSWVMEARGGTGWRSRTVRMRQKGVMFYWVYPACTLGQLWTCYLRNIQKHTRTLVYLKHMHVFAQIHKICERLEVVFSGCCSGWETSHTHTEEHRVWSQSWCRQRSYWNVSVTD